MLTRESLPRLARMLLASLLFLGLEACTPTLVVDGYVVRADGWNEAEQAVRQRAASDFSCAPEEVQVRLLHADGILPDQIRASGCGREAVYGPDPQAGWDSVIAQTDGPATSGGGPQGSEEAPDPGEGREGQSCESTSECPDGMNCMGGPGCGPEVGWTCRPAGPCTRDLATFCGCDGQEFQSSGSCPIRRYRARGRCE